MDTFHIHINGQVQGVGFRPFVFQLAHMLELTGWVQNGVDGVHIRFNANVATARRFLDLLISKAPSKSIIEHTSLIRVADEQFHDFQISDSSASGNRAVRISPDFAMCDDCKHEIDAASDPRYGYSFITCTNCGPRYSIISSLPYDRANTEMHKFKMCEECGQEYRDPYDRRFYSQTNSCPGCGVKLQLIMNGRISKMDASDQLRETVTAISDGKIVAVKGIGGFLLLCDANNNSSIEVLRKRKKRPHKPFAVMYPTIEHVKEDFVCSEDEIDMLCGAVSPVLLLMPKGKTNQVNRAVYPGLDRIGVMLPNSPVLYQISKLFGRALVATSGNVSGSPIEYQNIRVKERLASFADLILTNDRDIVVPQDDSVLIWNKGLKRFVVIRRSRGLSPSLFQYHGPIPSNSLGLGAQLKGTVSLQMGDQTYVSQYLGNLESYDAQLNYEKVLNHISRIANARPQLVATDMHPEYFTNQLAKSIPSEEIVYVQHHEAHFCAVLAENHLLEMQHKVLGVVWDGTGYGDDGMLWGGEFFTYNQKSIERVASLAPIAHLAGDQMQLEPRISALAYGLNLENDPQWLSSKFEEVEWNVLKNRLTHTDMQSSSMGRLFDAVASILGLIDKVSFEGQAAMYLEALAKQFGGRGRSYHFQIVTGKVQVCSIVQAIVQDVKNNIPVQEIAFNFHLTLVGIVREVACSQQISEIAFSGGVFQNSLLVDLLVKYLSGFSLYFHRDLSPNDECVSFGQLVYASIHKQQQTYQYKQDEAFV
ncbi:MAG: carbamoyltransferase HypF [Cyclobacteriaceae bacterium]